MQEHTRTHYSIASTILMISLLIVLFALAYSLISRFLQMRTEPSYNVFTDKTHGFQMTIPASWFEKNDPARQDELFFNSSAYKAEIIVMFLHDTTTVANLNKTIRIPEQQYALGNPAYNKFSSSTNSIPGADATKIYSYVSPIPGELGTDYQFEEDVYMCKNNSEIDIRGVIDMRAMTDSSSPTVIENIIRSITLI